MLSCAELQFCTNSENEVQVQELDKLSRGIRAMNHAVNCKQLLPATLRDSSRWHSSFQRVTPHKTVLLRLRPNSCLQTAPPHKRLSAVCKPAPPPQAFRTSRHRRRNTTKDSVPLSTAQTLCTALEFGWNGATTMLKPTTQKFHH